MGDGEAFGWPGLSLGWASAAKQGVGTSTTATSRVWFTLAQGVVTEVYYPRVDTPCTRDLQLLVTDGSSFFHEERRHLQHHVELIDPRALAYRLINTDQDGRYRIVKRVITDPDADVVLVHHRLEPLQVERLPRLYVLLAPRIAGQGSGNFAHVATHRGHDMLLACRDDVFLALTASCPFSRRSCGFVGASDGWTDLHSDYCMNWAFDSASDGNVALTGELELSDGAEFVLALGFGRTAEAAMDAAVASLAKGYAEVERQYVAGWREYCASLEDLSQQSGDSGRLYYRSAMVLRAHEDKTFRGAFVASLSIPWGETVHDASAGGYHLVWPRDLVQIAGACLAMDDGQAALRALKYLESTQDPATGGWAQNFWLDGRPFWRGVQLDEIAMPIVLAWRLHRVGVLDHDPYLTMVRPAALLLARVGPVTPQERWEENTGYSPATLAVGVTALLCAAEFAALHDEGDLAHYLRDVADTWASHIEDWTFTRCGELVPGHATHYERIALVQPASLDHAGAECRVLQPIANVAGGRRVSQCCIVDGGFLELVRYGVRAADGPHVLATLPVYDELLRVGTPCGPVWRRYNHDGYGEKADGTPYDGTGVGRAWPLLTGERGHYELAAGRDPAPYLRAMECFANEGGLLPEQVWDTADIPARGLSLGRGTGAATPLAWAHAEYIKLCRSRRDSQVFDLIPEVHERYVRNRTRSDLVICKFNHKVRAIRTDQRLRLEVHAPAELHWTRDGWTSVHHEPMTEVAPRTGIYVREFPPGSFTPGRPLEFTFYWPQEGRWEGRNFVIAVL
jgi:glucoamylase